MVFKNCWGWFFSFFLVGGGETQKKQNIEGEMNGPSLKRYNLFALYSFSDYDDD